MMSAELLNAIGVNIQNVITAVVGLICAIAIYGMNKATAKLSSRTQVEVVDKYLQILNNLVVTSVETTNQTFVDEIKAMDRNANDHGLIAFDLDAQREAFNRTKKAVMEHINEEMKNVLSEFVGDLNGYVDNLIESKVHEAKKSGVNNG